MVPREPCLQNQPCTQELRGFYTVRKVQLYIERLVYKVAGVQGCTLIIVHKLQSAWVRGCFQWRTLHEILGGGGEFQGPCKIYMSVPW